MCCVIFALSLAWEPGLQAQEPGAKRSMLKNELTVAGQIKLDKALRTRLMAVIRELDAKYSTWEENNGADFRRLLDESKKGAISDSARMMVLMEENRKIKDEIRAKISKELTPGQLAEFNDAVNALKIKETQRSVATSSGGTKPGMTPRQAVITLGLPQERAAVLKALIVEHEEKTAAAAKKRSEMMDEGQKLMESMEPKERSKGAAKIQEGQKVAGPPVDELDEQIIEKLSPELGKVYRKLRAGEETGLEKQAAARVLIGRMVDGEFNTLSEAVFPLADRAGAKEERLLRSKAVLEGLVTAMKPETFKFNRATRMTLLELSAETEIVDKPFSGLSVEQLRDIAEQLRGMSRQFKDAPTDKEKREAFSLGFSKAVNVLSVEQRVWVVSQAER